MSCDDIIVKAVLMLCCLLLLFYCLFFYAALSERIKMYIYKNVVSRHFLTY